MLRTAALCLLLTVPLFAGDNWPEFRGPTGDGHAAGKPPTRWSESENVRWKTPVHDKGWSSPVVWDEQVWLTTATEEGTKLFAVCVDRKSGTVVHDLPLFDVADPANIKQYNSHASPTPAIEAGRVYVHFGSNGTACLDTASGKVLWQRRDLPCNHWRGPASSPVIWQDKLFLCFDGFDRQYVVCLDKASGKTVWQKDRNLPYRNSGKPEVDGDYKKAYATPSVLTIDGRPQLVAPAAMGTVGYDPDTGAELWRVVTDGMNQASRPVLADGKVFVTAGHTSSLFAITAGGKGDVTKTHVAWKLAKAAPTRPSPIVVGDKLFCVNDTGTALCLDVRTGKQLWKESLDGRFSASPVFAGGHLYFANEAGKTFVVAAEAPYRLVETNRLDASCMASPAVAGNELFLRTKTHLYCIAQK
ncbi:MAG: PQQ-binding-like beta-propeller repeat protein [Gemmataceae bacterium]